MKTTLSPLRLLRRSYTLVFGDLLLLIQSAIARLPPEMIDGFSLSIIRAARAVMLRYKRVARINLDLVFGETRTQREKEAILRELFRNLGLGVAEYFFLLRHRAFPPDIAIRVEGEERLQAVLDRGKGVILAAGHYGNFFLLIAYLAHRGYPIHPITRLPRNPHLGAFLGGFQEALRIHPIPFKPRRECAQKSLSSLRANEILFLQLDQRPRKSECAVEFFGRKVDVYPGLEVLARRTGAAVLPVFIVQTAPHKHTVFIEEELLPGGEGDAPLIQSFTRLLEKYILAHPSQWWWFHRRFATELYARRRKA